MLGKPLTAATVGSASTLTLCTAGSRATPEVDPWLQADPWGPYNKGKLGPQPTPATEGLQQLEERIQNAVLSKMPNTMECDDMPDRLSTLESQVQMLMTKKPILGGAIHRIFSTKQQAICSCSTADLAAGSDFSRPVGEPDSERPSHV